MDDLQDRFSGFEQDAKHRFGGSNRSGDKSGPGRREESVGSSTSFPQSEPGVSTGGGHEQEGSGRSAENEHAGASAVVDKNRPDWGSTASSSAKLILQTVTADAFGPLKSVAGGLCFILENCEVRHLSSEAIGKLRCPQRTKANKQMIESLAPQVKELAERLCKPVSESDVEEQERRTRLEW